MTSNQQGPKNCKMAKWVIAALLAVFWQAGSAFSAGLGELKVISRMGQPFAGEIDLINVSREELATLQVALAPPAAYEAANLRFDPALNALKLSVERRPNGTPYVRATSYRRVNEPYMDLLVDLVSQHGKFRRGYAALLDPPELGEPAAVPPKATAAATPAKPAAPAIRTELTPPAVPPAPRIRKPAVAQSSTPGAASSAAAPAPVTSPPPAAATLSKTPAAPPAAATGTTVLTEAKPAVPATSEPPKSAPAEAAPAVTPPSTAEGSATTAATPSTATEPSLPEPPKAKPPAPQRGWIDSAMDYLLPVGGVILALLAGLAGWWALRRKKPEADTEVAVATAAAGRPATRNVSAVAASTAAAVLPASPIATEKAKAPAMEAPPVEHTVANVTDMVDPVEEATVYLKHSQDETAEKILRETLSKQPGREDALMMLLEILAQRGDTEGFNQLAGRLHKQTGGLGTNWKRAMAMGFALDPGYPLYSPPGSAPAQPSPVPAAESDLPRGEANDLGNTIDINLSPPDAALDMDKTMVLPYAGTKPPALPVEPLPDINFELPSASKPVAPAAPELPAFTASKEIPPLDFKIDLPDAGTKPQVVPTAAAHTLRDEHWENVQQKLDLARAYREMGDKDGAMELLAEVAREGDAAQQADARQIQESFG